MSKNYQVTRICDIHSHILFDLDDGSRNLKESIMLLNSAKEQKITDLFFTPHSWPDLEDYRTNYDRLKNYFSGINLYTGCEINCSGLAMEKLIHNLKNNDLCTMNHTDFLLIEFDPFESKAYICDYIRQLQANNYKIILAHVERYYHLFDEKILFELKERNVKFQINLYDVWDNSDEHTIQYTKFLYEHRLADFVGSDTHRIDHRNYNVSQGAAHLISTLDDQYLDDLFFGNSMKYLNINA